jgi:hypothetical protein
LVYHVWYFSKVLYHISWLHALVFHFLIFFGISFAPISNLGQTRGVCRVC